MSILNKFKKIFEFDETNYQAKVFERIEDYVLGTLSKTSKTENNFTGTIKYEDRQISFRLNQDNDYSVNIITHAKEVISELATWDMKAKETATKDLLKTYNEDWRFYAKTDPNDPKNTIEVEDPALDESSFISQLQLESLNINPGSISFNYPDNSLFAGHLIYVDALSQTETNSLDNMEFYASLFG